MALIQSARMVIRQRADLIIQTEEKAPGKEPGAFQFYV